MNYWQLLATAREALERSDFAAAEARLAAARAARGEDRRRRLLSETLPDGLSRLWRKARQRTADGEQPGRWERAESSLVDAFAAAAEAELTRAARQLDAGVTDDPREARELLARALYLSVASQLAPRRLPVSPLVRALFALLPMTGRLCDRELLPVDGDVDANTRRAVAAVACDHLDRLPAAERAAWCDHLLAMLDAVAPTRTATPVAADLEAAPADAGALDDAVDHDWLVARLADAHAAEATTALARWEACDREEMVTARRHWSRLRRLEILTDGDRRRLAVPRPRQARELVAALPREGDDQVAARARAAAAVLAHRHPQDRPSRAWIAAAAAPDGTVHAVCWWGEEPRAVATWRPDDAPEDLQALVGEAEGRLVWTGEEVPAPVAGGWPPEVRGRALAPLAEAILEPLLPRSGWDADLARRLALARSGPWRDGWRDDLGDPRLLPPGRDGRLRPEQAELEPALHAGLLWLAVRHRLQVADPALRAGLGELGRRGAAAAAFLHTGAVLGAPDHAAVDAAFAPWTLPLLWTRPDPLTDALAVTDQDDAGPGREDLAGQDVAVVLTGRAGRALAAWGPQERRWRVVCDRGDRWRELRRQAREAYGPVTVVPPAGQVHHLGAALRLLEELAVEDDLLAVCHWVRLVESHNGDLLDLQALRPRPRGACPLHDRYAARVADLPRHSVAEGDGDDGGWGDQYVQRARRSGLVAGLATDLPVQAGALDAVWGVFDGSDAAWVFLDSAAVHWQLWHRDAGLPARLHGLLVARGRRHLSLLAGRGWCPEDLAGWFDRVLAGYGRPYHGDLGDARPPRLALAAAAPLPGARLAPAAATAAPLVRLAASGPQTVVLAPLAPAGAAFWRAAAAGRFGSVSWELASELPAAAARLVVTELAGLSALAMAREPSAGPQADTVAAWAAADARRARLRDEARGLTALECAACLASGAGVVEVLDARWWRWLARADDAPAAAAELGVADAELIDLEPAAATDVVAAVGAWRSEQGEVPGQLAGWSGPPLGEAAAPTGGGVRYVPAPGAELWRDLAADLLSSWELGRPVSPLMLLADSPPPGAAAVAAALAAPGATLLSPAGAANPAPLLWARPADLLAGLRSGVPVPAGARVLVLDAQRLLPDAGPDHRDTGGARLLAWLRERRPARVDLVGDPLPAPWLEHLAAVLAAEVPEPAPEPGGWPQLRRGPRLEVVRRCPQCQQAGAGGLDGRICRACGFQLASPPFGAPGDGEAGQRARARLLLGQADRGHDQPAEIWGDPGELAGLRTEALAAGATLASPPQTWLTLPDGRRWSLRPLPTGVSARGPALLLHPPADPALLQPRAPTPPRGELTLLYDRHDLDRTDPGSAAGAARLLQLLHDADWLDRTAADLRPGASFEPAIPLWRLAWLAGLPEPAVRRTLARLRWLEALAGSPADAAEPEVAGPPELRVLVPPREQELILASLAARLDATLGALLAGGAPGAWHEVAAPTGLTVSGPPPTDQAGADAADDLLDRLLGRLAAAGGPLLYACREGAWFSGRRQVGWLGPREEVAGALSGHLDHLMAWSEQLLAGTSRVDAGDRVPLPAAPAAAERLALSLGEELGFWTVRAPAGSGRVGLELLRQLAASASLAPDGAATRLITRLSGAAAVWHDRLAATPAGGRIVPSPAGPGHHPGQVSDRETRRPRWWPRRRDHLAPVRRAVERVAVAAGPGRLVVSGVPGSDRTASVLAGLLAAEGGRRVVVWCPDLDTAVAAHLTARALEPAWQPDLRVWSAGGGTPSPVPVPPGARRLAVVLELQRYPREVAYQLQESAREGGLVMTLDSAITGRGVREDLLLTTPRREENQHLAVAQRMAQEPWRAVLPLLPTGVAEARPARRERGQVQARRAGSLDECAAAIAAARTAGRLGPLVDVVAPVAEDVSLLRRALADRGWSAVTLATLGPHLLPGGLELTCALADAHRQAHGEWPGGGEAPAADTPWLLAGLLPPHQGADWRSWLRLLPPTALAESRTFLAWLRRSPWGLRCTGTAAARHQVARLSAAAGDRAPGHALDPAGWRAWRARVAVELTGAAPVFSSPSLPPAGPVAVLASADAPGAGSAESLVYVCFGSEPVGVHRPVLLRASDRLLVLYQEHSPLPGDGEVGLDG